MTWGAFLAFHCVQSNFFFFFFFWNTHLLVIRTKVYWSIRAPPRFNIVVFLRREKVVHLYKAHDGYRERRQSSFSNNFEGVSTRKWARNLGLEY